MSSQKAVLLLIDDYDKEKPRVLRYQANSHFDLGKNRKLMHGEKFLNSNHVKMALLGVLASCC